MLRLLRPGLPLLAAIALLTSPRPYAAQPATGRALTIEDYYRIQTVGNPLLSPDGRWVSYSISTRIEDDQQTRLEFWLVPADASTKPWRVLHYGRDIAGPRWTPDNRLEDVADRLQWTINPANPSAPPLRSESQRAGGGGGRGGRGGAAAGQDSPGIPSPDGKWVATLADVAQNKPSQPAVSDFERRHEERFKGVIFDWKDFQRDGQPFPAPNLRARPAQQVMLAPASGGDAKGAHRRGHQAG